MRPKHNLSQEKTAVCAALSLVACRPKMKTAVCAAIVAVLSLVSCRPETAYYEFRHTDTELWQRDDTLTFGVPPQADSAACREDLAIRATQRYPYTALTLIVRQSVVARRTTLPLRTDTLNITIDGAAGGTAYRNIRLHLADTRLAKGDSLEVKVTHNMRREALPGIADIGFSLTRR